MGPSHSHRTWTRRDTRHESDEATGPQLVEYGSRWRFQPQRPYDSAHDERCMPIWARTYGVRPQKQKRLGYARRRQFLSDPSSHGQVEMLVSPPAPRILPPFTKRELESDQMPVTMEQETKRAPRPVSSSEPFQNSPQIALLFSESQYPLP